MKNYIIYDGRALLDIDSAEIVETFEAKNNPKAIKYFKKYYRDMDVVLADSVNNIIYQVSDDYG